jgi:hypothetical protein
MKRRSFGAADADADGDEMASDRPTDDAGMEEMAMDAAEPMTLQAGAYTRSLQSST